MVTDLKLSLGSRCIKYLLFSFNFFFVITGIILLAIGATIHAVYNDYHHFLDDKFFSVPSLCIVVGAIIFFIAFFGCCGAVRESYCMIVTFAALMILIFILELAAGISGYALRNNAAQAIEEKMKTTMKEYNNTQEIRTVWDELQHEFECCGFNNYTDWKNIIGDKLPNSCCINRPNCTIADKESDFHHNGCATSFTQFIKSHAVQLGGAGIGIAFVQAIGIWFAIYLARTIKNNYETV
ncbi:CD63 antigen [Chelonus insularis]|uniref:CD63 antigen n=1 Tax=Chelonus insularis TaxID=460826 RepID=UPI00158BBEF4|nr:CD63 antigen [Chelonus insularis]